MSNKYSSSRRWMPVISESILGRTNRRRAGRAAIRCGVGSKGTRLAAGVFAVLTLSWMEAPVNAQDVTTVTVRAAKPPTFWDVWFDQYNFYYEDEGPAVFIIERSNIETAFTVNFKITMEGDYLSGKPPSSVRFRTLGEYTARVSVMLDDDNVWEFHDTSNPKLTLQLESGSGYAVGDPGSAYTVILDDDASPRPTLSLSTTSIGENGGTVTASVGTGSTTFSTDMTIVLTFSSDYNPNATLGVDYSVSGGSGKPREAYYLTLPAKTNSVAAEITILDDSRFEGDEHIDVAAWNHWPRLPLGSVQRLTIVDDEGPPTVAISNLGTAVASEDGFLSRLRFRFALSTRSVQHTEVQYVLGGTATLGVDYEVMHRPASQRANPSGKQKIQRGSLGSTLSIRVLDDRIEELTETLTVTLVGIAAGEAALGSKVKAAGEIFSDDFYFPEATVSATTNAVGESQVGGALVFSVSLSELQNREITVLYRLGGSATAGEDYADPGGGSVTIPIGAASADITLPVVWDDVGDESMETVEITLAEVVDQAGTLGSQVTASGTIANSEEGPPLVVQQQTAVDAPTASPEVPVEAPIDGTVADGDGKPPPIVQQPAIVDEPTAITEDPVEAPVDGTVADGDAGLPPTVQQQTAVDAPTAVPKISVEAPAGQGSDSDPLAFKVTLDQPSDRRVTVDYTVSVSAVITAASGAAFAGLRGVAPPRSRLVFEPGETTKEIVVEIPDSGSAGPERSVKLSFSSPVGAEFSTDLADASGIATRIVGGDEANWQASRADTLIHTLAGVGRSATAAVVDRIWDRVDFHTAGGGSSASIGGHALASVSPSAVDAGSGYGDVGSRRRMSVSDGDDLARNSRFNLLLGDRSSGGEVAVWGRGDVSSFGSGLGGGRYPGLSSDGRSQAGDLGFDVRASGNMFFGLAASRIESEVEYAYSGPNRDGGTINSEIVGLWPYAHYQFADGVGVWAMVGSGSGTAELKDANAVGVETDISLRMVALGSRSAARSLGSSSITLKGDVLLAEVAVGEAAGIDLMRKTAIESSRARLVLESANRLSLSGGGVVTGTYGLGVRFDGGDAERGLGADFTAELLRANPADGLEMSLRAGAPLLRRQAGFSGWGMGAGVSYQPDSSGRGFSISLDPVWGAPVERDVVSGWSIGYDHPIIEASGRDASVKTRLGYGVGVLHGRALLTWYGEAEGATEGDDRLRLGVELLPPEFGRFVLDVHGERRGGDGRFENAAMLEGRFRF